jgi:hypothetical protein
MHRGIPVIHTFEIGLHGQFIGKILNVKSEESMPGKDSKPDIRKSIQCDLCLMRAFQKTGEYIGDACSIGKARA